MGVIQNNVNQLLTMAAVGARTSNRYKDMNTLKDSLAKEDVLKSKLNKAGEQLAGYTQESLKNADPDTKANYDNAAATRNGALKELQDNAMLQQQLGEKYKDKFQFKNVSKNAQEKLNEYDEWGGIAPSSSEIQSYYDKMDKKAQTALDEKDALLSKIAEQTEAVAAIRQALQGNQEPQTLLYDANGKPLIRGDK